ICTMSGWSAGLPFRAKIFLSAAGLVASAPSPYTVSVAKATRSPAASRRAARSISPASIQDASHLEHRAFHYAHGPSAGADALELALEVRSRGRVEGSSRNRHCLGAEP